MPTRDDYDTAGDRHRLPLPEVQILARGPMREAERRLGIRVASRATAHPIILAQILALLTALCLTCEEFKRTAFGPVSGVHLSHVYASLIASRALLHEWAHGSGMPAFLIGGRFAHRRARAPESLEAPTLKDALSWTAPRPLFTASDYDLPYPESIDCETSRDAVTSSEAH